MGFVVSLDKRLHVGVLRLLLDGEDLSDLSICDNEDGGDESESTH